MEVVILAGGKGRRFGSTKQFTPVDSDGKSLLEVSLADSRQAGCTHAIIVTAPDLENEVRELFETRPIDGLNITVAIQHLEDLPEPISNKRERPWGTAHALWAARKAVSGPFLLFNADDYYGPNASRILAAALDADMSPSSFAMLGYPLGTTLSGAGTVSRAICKTDAKGFLKGLQEFPSIDARGCADNASGNGVQLPLNSLVSMNAWAFTPQIFPMLETSLKKFLATADLDQDECYLPATIDDGVRSGQIKVRVATTQDLWCGMTWLEDREHVSRRLAELAGLKKAAAGFGFDVSQKFPVPFGTGLINSMWQLDTSEGPRLLQRLNSDVFSDPVLIAENAHTVSRRINSALIAQGDNDPRHRLLYLESATGHPWLNLNEGGVWRGLVQIPNSRPANPSSAEEIKAAAMAFGRFPGLVAEGKGPEPREVMPGFHDTKVRLNALKIAADQDTCGRLKSCQQEVTFLISLAGLADRLPQQNPPLRIVHNDAKLDNVLVDADSGEALCVIDFDTTMPGFAAHDFGDLIRTSVTGCPEDEPHLNRVVVNENVFDNLVKGYLAGARQWITDAERLQLVDGALVITYEQTIRFLSDYLAGDLYYQTKSPDHNLQRAKTQLQLLKGLLGAENNLRQIVRSI